MENLVVHRIVEQHAATRGEVIALQRDGDNITYRELNIRANGVARRLLDTGFRRGSHLTVAIDHGIDLATVLLAVLKAGGAYTWQPCADTRSSWRAACASRPEDDPTAYRPIDIQSLLRYSVRTSPNLPILTRPSDLACVLSSEGRRLFVPHSTLTSLQRETSAAPQVWDGDTSTFDLWVGLMCGTTISIAPAPALLNAA